MGRVRWLGPDELTVWHHTDYFRLKVYTIFGLRAEWMFWQVSQAEAEGGIEDRRQRGDAVSEVARC